MVRKNARYYKYTAKKKGKKTTGVVRTYLEKPVVYLKKKAAQQGKTLTMTRIPRDVAIKRAKKSSKKGLKLSGNQYTRVIITSRK